MLRRRFTRDEIYTYTGNVLISVNPYKAIPDLYLSPDMELQASKWGNVTKTSAVHVSSSERVVQTGVEAAVETPVPEAALPHVYEIARSALEHKDRSFLSSRHALAHHTLANQSVIISGESGAGKTEASKHIIRFLGTKHLFLFITCLLPTSTHFHPLPPTPTHSYPLPPTPTHSYNLLQPPTSYILTRSYPS